MLSRIRATAAAACEKGTLKSIETSHEVLRSDPPFLVRVLKNLSQKSATANNKDELGRDPTASAPAPKFNPFLPYDPSMYVQHLPPDHVLLLNKFNVVADHTLIVTEKFEEQSSLLTASDFAAMWVCLSEVGGLCFYNAGKIAGASQRHKHLQHVGGSFIDGVCVTPFDETVEGGLSDGVMHSVKELDFVHGVVGMGDVAGMARGGETEVAAAVSMQRYTELLRMVGGDGGVQGGGLMVDGDERQPFAYNLVCTRAWMMLVPRRKECFEGISVNSLGFVGCLLVRDEQQLEIVRKIGGMKVLKEVGFAVNGGDSINVDSGSSSQGNTTTTN